ncbi:MAG: hypothetical protein LJE69_02185 [Thiohalocapsa sp.]|jgi:hypothetical protein|uniref:hypothetical protein n=1 Tax=Thiohalocapsa sp. TaxID=2497641 RepID=UPI0025F00EC3|nr:hypothetical protein [Thiohalocapsa sp.]MCG6940041.1 hypothetical protein [Thiohalocapsa sp.]
MPVPLKPRRLGLGGTSFLELSPDPDLPRRYLVRFCGFDRDRGAQAATERARVRLLLASQRGQAPHPYPLPPRVIIGSIDRDGWHCGRSPYALPLAELPAVRAQIEQLLADLTLRVALAAAAHESRRQIPAGSSPPDGHGRKPA